MIYPTPESHPELFENETRRVRDRIITMPVISWRSFEWMLNETHFTEADLLAVGDEEAELRNITFDEYFRHGLACMVHCFEQHPELRNRNEDNGRLVGYIGPVSRMQIEELEKQQKED